MSQPISRKINDLIGCLEPFLTFAARWEQTIGNPDVSDFAFGNPHEMPLPAFGETLSRWLVPQNKDWFAYKMNEPTAQQAVASTLKERRGVGFDPLDVFLTPGAFGAIAVALRSICDHDDEVIFLSPPWFFYEAMIILADARPVRVKLAPPSFDLDVDAIAAAITPKTRAVIVNSPQNPTGRLYGAEELRRLAAVLDEASERNGRPLYLLSDEAYHRILYDGRTYLSPTSLYPRSLLLYTYGKTLLAPGQRLGYIALPPDMPDREQLRAAIFFTQIGLGWMFPNALMQYALPDLEGLSIDIGHLQAKRDRLVAALRDMGYEANVPEGTFYVLARSPIANDAEFCDLLVERDVFVLPGHTFELPGYFRISLTANDGMIDRALPGFASAMERVRARAATAGS